MEPREYAKAIVGGITAGLTSAIGGITPDGSMSTVDWLTVVLSVVTVAGAVFTTPNRPSVRPEPVQEDAGEADGLGGGQGLSGPVD